MIETTQPQGPTIEGANPEMEAFIAEVTNRYKIEGVHPVEAAQRAAHDWEEMNKLKEAQGDAAWQEFAKNVGLAEILDDQIRRALGVYKTMWSKEHAPQTIDFKLELKAKGKDDLEYSSYEGKHKRLIAEVILALSVSINGVWALWRQKYIKFEHIREMKQGHAWKLALYEAMLQDIIGWGATNYVNIRLLRENPPKPTPIMEVNKETPNDEPHDKPTE